MSVNDSKPSFLPGVEALLNNGLDFLDKARNELETGQAKFSVVSFWTAVEILLKVPLVHEHWTLVCSGKKIVRQKYLAGDFQSVTYDETCARLGEVLEKPLPKDTMAFFDKVRQHRNRVVHFYHSAFNDEDQQKILAEQADAWFALNRLLRDDWSSLLGTLLRAQLAINETTMLQSSEFYAAAKFREAGLQEQLISAVNKGKTIHSCDVCHQDALTRGIIDDRTAGVVDKCLVCHYHHHYITVNCPACEEKQKLEQDDTLFTCRCGHTEDRYVVLSQDDWTNDDFLCHANDTPAGCSDCEREDTVCHYGETYLCTMCFTLHDAVGCCESCSYNSTNISSTSSISGCSFCEGNWR